MATDMLVGNELYKSYGSTAALCGVTVTVQSGQITVVIGPSGGGKSTLIRALSLLDPPDSGTVKLDNTTYEYPWRNGTGFKPPWPTVTVVFQQLFLWPHLTIRDNILLPLRNAERLNAANRAEELIDSFGMGEYAGRHPNEVSLGQRQRAALARAVALRPKYLLLDEITSALDVEHVGKILDYLKKLRDEGTGILIVTHLIGFAKGAADQVVFMENGSIVEEGGPDLLLRPRNGRLARFLSLVDSKF